MVEMKVPYRDNRKVILFVCPETSWLEYVVYSLVEDRGNYVVLGAVNAEKGIKIFNERQVDLVCTWLFIPGMDGLQFIEYLQKERPGIPCLAFSTSGTPEMVNAVKRKGGLAHVDMPIDHDELLTLIDRALYPQYHLDERWRTWNYHEGLIIRECVKRPCTFRDSMKNSQSVKFLKNCPNCGALLDITLVLMNLVIKYYWGWDTFELTDRHGNQIKIDGTDSPNAIKFMRDHYNFSGWSKEVFERKEEKEG